MNSFPVQTVGRLALVVEAPDGEFSHYTRLVGRVAGAISDIADVEGPRLAAEKTGVFVRGGKTPTTTEERTVEADDLRLSYHWELIADQKLLDETLVGGLLDIADEATEPRLRGGLEAIAREQGGDPFDDIDRAADELGL